LDWNAVKDVVGSRSLAAGGENQNEQDPTQLRSSSDNHGQNNLPGLLHHEARNKGAHSLLL